MWFLKKNSFVEEKKMSSRKKVRKTSDTADVKFHKEALEKYILSFKGEHSLDYLFKKGEKYIEEHKKELTPAEWEKVKLYVINAILPKYPVRIVSRRIRGRGKTGTSRMKEEEEEDNE